MNAILIELEVEKITCKIRECSALKLMARTPLEIALLDTLIEDYEAELEEIREVA